MSHKHWGTPKGPRTRHLSQSLSIQCPSFQGAGVPIDQTMSSAAPQDALASQAQAQASGSKKKKNKKNKPKKNLDTLSNSKDGAGTVEPEPSPRDSLSNNNNLSADEEPDTSVVSTEHDTRTHIQREREGDPLSPGLADTRLPGWLDTWAILDRGILSPGPLPHGHGKLVRKCDLLSLTCLDRPKAVTPKRKPKTRPVQVPPRRPNHKRTDMCERRQETATQSPPTHPQRQRQAVRRTRARY